MKVLKEDGNIAIVEKLKIADSFFDRLKGYMLKKRISGNEGLLLTNTKQIHTFWMLTDIDVVYLKRIDDKTYYIIGLQKGLKPWRIGCLYKNATAILELKSGKIDATDIKIGDKIEIKQ